MKSYFQSPLFCCVPIGLAGLLALVSIMLCVSCGPQPDSPDVRASAASETNGTEAAASTVIKPEFKKLEGKWERPDGGYVLELKNVDASGKFEAGYFNPSAINVSKALALKEGDTVKLFVELRDVNYPGCTYSLTYDPQTDQLFGQYFQASMQQTYDITFGRLPE